MITVEEALKEQKHVRRSKISPSLLTRLETEYGFSTKEITYLKKNFLKIAPKGIMDFRLWQNSMMIMNVPKAEYLAK